MKVNKQNDFNALYTGDDFQGKPNVEHKHWWYDSHTKNGQVDVLMMGFIDYELMQKRPSNEKYLVVVHNQNDILPANYKQMLDVHVEGEKLISVYDGIVYLMCHASGAIQMVSKLSDNKYLLGSGPDKINIDDEAYEILFAYNEINKPVETPPKKEETDDFGSNNINLSDSDKNCQELLEQIKMLVQQNKNTELELVNNSCRILTESISENAEMKKLPFEVLEGMINIAKDSDNQKNVILNMLSGWGLIIDGAAGIAGPDGEIKKVAPYTDSYDPSQPDSFTNIYPTTASTKVENLKSAMADRTNNRARMTAQHITHFMSKSKYPTLNGTKNEALLEIIKSQMFAQLDRVEKEESYLVDIATNWAEQVDIIRGMPPSSSFTK